MKFKNFRNWEKQTFLQWLTTRNHVDNEDIINYENNLKLYKVEKKETKISYNRNFNKEAMIEILKKDNFLFVK